MAIGFRKPDMKGDGHDIDALGAQPGEDRLREMQPRRRHFERARLGGIDVAIALHALAQVLQRGRVAPSEALQHVVEIALELEPHDPQIVRIRTQQHRAHLAAADADPAPAPRMPRGAYLREPAVGVLAEQDERNPAVRAFAVEPVVHDEAVVDDERVALVEPGFEIAELGVLDPFARGRAPPAARRRGVRRAIRAAWTVSAAPAPETRTPPSSCRARSWIRRAITEQEMETTKGRFCEDWLAEPVDSDSVSTAATGPPSPVRTLSLRTATARQPSLASRAKAGARGRNRTDMPLRALDFESAASNIKSLIFNDYFHIIDPMCKECERLCGPRPNIRCPLSPGIPHAWGGSPTAKIIRAAPPLCARLVRL